MSKDMGAPPTGSGYSAEPEPSYTVSAVPVSIPNATKRPKNWPLRKWKNYKHNAKRRHAPRNGERLYMVFREGGDLPTVVHADYRRAVSEASRLSHFIPGERFHVLVSQQVWCRASAIEARQGQDAQRLEAKHESAVGNAETPKTSGETQP